MSRDRLGRGFTLVEAMVALALSLLVVGVLLQAGLDAIRSCRSLEALVQVTDDATLALAVMRQQVAQAGFSLPVGPGGAGRRGFPAVLGCEGAPFHDLQAGVLAPPSCDPPSGGSFPEPADTLEVAYEGSVLPAGASDGILGGLSGREPLDCLGNAFPRTVDPVNGDYYLVDSKFYVDAGSLRCHGPGNTAGAPVAQGIETLQVTYGMAAGPPGAAGAGQVAYYGSAPAVGSPDWAGVVAVGLCVQVRSAERVLEASAAATSGAWVDCHGARRASADGYLRRTFSTTVLLRNGQP